MRIVSLLPSATDILVALGAAAEVVGISAHCDPPEGLAPGVVTAPDGTPLAEAVIELRPDLVIADPDRLASLPPALHTRTLPLNPRTLDEVLATIATIGEAAGREEAATELLAEQRRHLAVLLRWAMLKHRPRVVFLEWVDPPRGPSMWVPEMLAIAGAESLLGERAQPSGETSWEALRALAPDAVVLGPCGHTRAEAEALLGEVRRLAGLPEDTRYLAVDSRRGWSRPGLGIPDAIEDLALWLHPGSSATR